MAWPSGWPETFMIEPGAITEVEVKLMDLAAESTSFGGSCPLVAYIDEVLINFTDYETREGHAR